MSIERTYYTAEELGVFQLERPASERAGFPRFLVIVDEQMHRLETPRSLRKFLATIYGRRPHVYVNAGKGVTIDYDVVLGWRWEYQTPMGPDWRR